MNPENVLPYRFKKGQSGNPRGRPKEPWREWLTGKPEEEARALIAHLIRDQRGKPETRLRAAQYLLDHAHGRAKETVENGQRRA
jgi:hypothetical protein